MVKVESFRRLTNLWFYVQMLKHYWVAFFVVVFWVVNFRVLDASAGDADPLYR